VMIRLPRWTGALVLGCACVACTGGGSDTQSEFTAESTPALGLQSEPVVWSAVEGRQGWLFMGATVGRGSDVEWATVPVFVAGGASGTHRIPSIGQVIGLASDQSLVRRDHGGALLEPWAEKRLTTSHYVPGVLPSGTQLRIEDMHFEPVPDGSDLTAVWALVSPQVPTPR
jgi:hypothetical protein